MYNFKRKKPQKKILYKNRKINKIKHPIALNLENLDPRATITFAINNLFLNIACRMKKNPKLFSNIFWTSCGSQKFAKPQYKSSTKTTYISNYALGNVLSYRLKKIKFMTPVTLIIKGSGRYFNSFIKSFKINYKKKFGILDLTPIALNGCRKKKQRRV